VGNFYGWAAEEERKNVAIEACGIPGEKHRDRGLKKVSSARFRGTGGARGGGTKPVRQLVVFEGKGRRGRSRGGGGVGLS